MGNNSVVWTDERRKQYAEVLKKRRETNPEWFDSRGRARSPAQQAQLKKVAQANRDRVWTPEKGGRYITHTGYVLVHAPNHPNRIKRHMMLEHRLVMEKHLGRYLTPEEVVHHINEDKTDNRIENLMLFPNDEAHQAHHVMLRKQNV
jgi:hypothetical protein